MPSGNDRRAAGELWIDSVQFRTFWENTVALAVTSLNVCLENGDCALQQRAKARGDNVAPQADCDHFASSD
jgi:hypothetical protein